ncbi:MAG TPA: carboxylate-amine ligase [Thermoanaerobaculia bacterium]|nr:carboxylate-amine ligase [Thermoanaerobaculia bacterium]
MGGETFTIGIEEEYQVIDPESRGLTSYVQEFLDEGRLILQDQIKPEFLQSQIEVGSHICRNIHEAREDLVRLRSAVVELAESKGVQVAAASTHPFSSWLTQKITPAERYAKHEEAMADVARRMLIFGMHVHVGIDDRELLIDVMDQSRYFLPHLLALSTSSPFWHGRTTGLKSYRSVVFESLPRTGPPPSFHSWSEYERFVETLVAARCIEDGKSIWWDIRPHPKFPTLEFRVFDICTRVDEAICLAALTLAIVAKLVKLRRNNQSWRRYRHHLVAENKWRAVRYGIEGKLIDFGRGEEVPVAELAEQLLELVDDVVDELDLREAVSYVHTILRDGTSADRQLATYRETGDFTAVVDRVVAETRAGLD